MPGFTDKISPKSGHLCRMSGARRPRRFGKQMDERIARLLTSALQDQPRSRIQAPHGEPIEEHEKEAAPLPKAA
jgi:hypothetical protein